MDLPTNDPRVARKKSWYGFPKGTVRYESHLVTISAKRFQKSPAKCLAFCVIFYLLCCAFQRHVMFFVPELGKLTGCGLYNRTQTHRCGGATPGQR